MKPQRGQTAAFTFSRGVTRRSWEMSASSDLLKPWVSHPSSTSMILSIWTVFMGRVRVGHVFQQVQVWLVIFPQFYTLK